MNRRPFVVILSLLLISPSCLLAEDVPQPPAGETPFAFTLTGTLSAAAASTNVRLEMKSGTVLAFRVYSEPSQTLLAAFADNSQGDPQASSWWREIFPVEEQIAIAPLQTGSKILQQGRVALSTDKKIAIHMFGIWPGEAKPRDGVIRVATDPRSFGFTINEYSTMGLICCNIAIDQCGGRCRWCSGSEYRCCKFTGGCGWCNEVKPECTSDPCPGC